MFRQPVPLMSTIMASYGYPAGLPCHRCCPVVAAMGNARYHEPGIFLLANVGQFLEKRSARPEFFIAVIPPRRHAGHLDAVLDDPQELGGAIECRGVSKIRWLRVKAARDIAFRHSGRAVPWLHPRRNDRRGGLCVL